MSLTLLIITEHELRRKGGIPGGNLFPTGQGIDEER